MKAKLEELANDFLSSDFLKGLINVGSQAITVIDEIVSKLGMIPSILTGAGIFGLAKKAISSAKSMKFDGASTANIISKLFEKFGYMTGKNATEFASSATFSNLTKDISDEMLVLAANSGQFEKETATAILASRGLDNQLGKAKSGFTLFKEGIKDAGKSLGSFAKEIAVFLGTNPVGWAIDVAAAIAIACAAYKKLHTSAKEANENIQTAFDNSSSQIESVQEQKDTVNSLSESYEKLSKGVNTSTNENISLSTNSYQEYLDTCNDIADMYPDLVAGYDAQGNAILTLKGNVDGLTEAYKKAQQEAYATAYLGYEDEDGNRTGTATDRELAFDYATDTFDDNDSLLAKWGKSIAQGQTQAKILTTTNELMAEYKKMATMSDSELKEYITSTGADTSVTAKQFAETIADGTAEAYDKVRKTCNDKLQELSEDQAEIVSNEVTALEGYMKGVTDASGSNLVSGYDKLTEKQQSFADNLLSSTLDLDTIQSFQDSGDFAKAEQEWVNNIVSSISNMSASAKSAYDDLQEAISVPDDLTSANIETIDNYLDTLSNELNVSKDKLKEIFNLDDVFDTEETFNTKLNEYLSAPVDNSEIEAAYKALDNYKAVVQEAKDLGVDLDQTVFGNIDTNNRQVLEWTNNTLNQYKDALQSWDKEAANDWSQFASDMEGSISTVFGASKEYDGVEIAFSPMLQTEDGAVLLSSSTVDTYINSLISELGDGWTNEDLLSLDAEGLDIDGTHIKNLIADIGDTAIQTGEAMHYMGQDGAIALAAENVEQYSEVLEDSFDTVSSAQKTADTESKSIAKTTKNIKTNTQALKWMKENCDSLTVSQKKMFLEAATDSKSALETMQNFHDLLEDNALNSLSIDISTVTDNISNMNTALSESASATGLTADSISNIESMYSSLDGYDASKLFENTANGVKLNREELEKLNAEYDKQNTQDAQEQLSLLTDKYNDLTEQINNCSDASELANLYSQRDAVMDQINDVQQLISEYDGLTSAFNQWQNAQSETSPGANYDSIYSYLETANEMAADGKWGNPAFKEFIELMSGQDMTDASIDEMAAAWEGLANKISDTGYSLGDFLSEDSTGVENFLDMLDKLGGYITDGENGESIINIDSMEDLADKMGTDVSFVQVLLDKLSEYGYKINVDSSDLDLMTTNAETAAEKLNELGFDHVFNFSATGDELTDEIKAAEDILNTFKKEDGSIDLSVEGASEAQQVLVTLLSQKEALAEPTIMSIDLEKLTGTNKSVIDYLQNIQSTIDGYQIKLGANMDTTDMTEKVGDALDYLDKIPEKAKETLGLTDLKISEAVSTLKQNIADGVTLDENAISTIEKALSSISPEILADLGIDMDSVEKEANETAEAFETALTNVLSRLTITIDGKEIEFDIDPVEVKVDADTSSANKKTENYKKSLESLSIQKYQPKVDADTSSANKKTEKTKKTLQSLSSQKYQTTLTANNSDVYSKKSAAESALSSFAGKTYTAYMSVTSSVKKVANAGVSALINVANKITGGNKADGTFHGYANGTNVSISKNETALVNEIGTEGLLRNGVLTEIPGGAQLINLRKGDIIFNSRQLEQLRESGYVTANGGHGTLVGGYASGTLTGLSAFYTGSGSGKIKKSTSKSLGSGSSSSSSSKSSSSKSSSGSSGSSSSGSSGSSSSNSSSSSSTSDEAEETEETLDWIETKISRVERVITNLGKTVSATYKSWSQRNNSLAQELSDVNSEISIQQQAYNRYMQEANSVGLDAGYAQKVRDGKIDIETITDDDLKEKIENYTTW